MRIAGHAEVLPVAPIETELERVIAKRVGGVTDPLEFVLLLVERAVALIDGKGVTKVKAAGAAQRESRHARGVIGIEVQAGDARVFRRRCAKSVRVDEHAVAEET